jgi:hypothetical protein
MSLHGGPWVAATTRAVFAREMSKRGDPSPPPAWGRSYRRGNAGNRRCRSNLEVLPLVPAFLFLCKLLNRQNAVANRLRRLPIQDDIPRTNCPASEPRLFVKAGTARAADSSRSFRSRTCRAGLGGPPDLFHTLFDLLSGVVGHFERHVGYPTAALQGGFHGVSHHVTL